MSTPPILASTDFSAGADLLVIGRHGRSALEERLLGSVALNLLHHAPCDVLLAP